MSPRRRCLRHPRLHLPPLDAACALTLVDILERAIAAIWRAHGDAMVELIGARDLEPERETEPGDEDLF